MTNINKTTQSQGNNNAFKNIAKGMYNKTKEVAGDVNAAKNKLSEKIGKYFNPSTNKETESFSKLQQEKNATVQKSAELELQLQQKSIEKAVYNTF